ncbi:MAG: helix-turn-helix transcriptional regulator [Saprospiraceae bacterium]
MYIYYLVVLNSFHGILVMLKKYIPYWEDMYSLKPLEVFLKGVKDSFENEEIKEDAIRLLHRHSRLEAHRNKGVLDNKDYLTTESEISASAFEILKKISNEYLPILPVKAIAGDESGHQYAVESHEIEEWRLISKLETKGRIGIRVQGKSMQPLYKEGDILICKKMLLGRITERQNIVVVDVNNNIFVKRIKKKGDSIALVSLNEEFKTFEIPIDEIKEYWKVEEKIK